MAKRTYILFSILVFSFWVGAQKADLDSAEYIEYYPHTFERLSIGISPSSFLNVYYGPQFSLDVGLTDRWNIPLEIAYLADNLEVGVISKGFRFKGGIEGIIFDDGIGIILGAHLNLRRSYELAEFRQEFWDQNFTKSYDIRRNRTLLGGLLYLGIQGKLSDRIRLEFGGGVGAGNFSVKYQNDIPENSREVNNSFIWIDDSTSGSAIWPLLSLNVNVAYDIVLFDE